MKEAAITCGMFYIDQRWLGGMLTNFKTIRTRVERLKKLEAMEQDGTFEVLPKKEVILLKKEMAKLETNLGGIKDMDELPGVIFIVDSKKEEIAIKEANKLNIPVVGLVDTNCNPEDVDYVIISNESGALLSDLDTNHGDSEISTYEVIETLKSDVENLIDDTNLTSTTSTVSASKVKNAITYSFDTQSGSVKYVKFKLSITTISVVDIYGGKIEILGASKAAANPSYKTVKVVRLSYGDWGSYDATQVPSVVHTKIGELYYYPTDEYYYLKLYNYAAFTMTGLATTPEIITSLPAEESAMTLIPESNWGKIDDTTSSTESTWSSSKIASEIGAKITKTQYRGSRSIDISTGGKLTLICSSEYASQAGCYMLLSNYNTTPLLIELGKFPQSSFNVTATNKSFGVDTITVTTASDEYSWYVLQF